MSRDLQALAARIRDYRFDEPSANVKFIDRLAKDQGWSSRYAQCVLEEYRRFAYLSVAAGHAVAPSDAVDQVWHLHLTFTRAYWKQFCGEVLEHALHHEPSRGGEEESLKLLDWYERTLASYRTHFGDEPPADIWPPAALRFSGLSRWQRADKRRHWLIPKLRVKRVALAFGASAVVLVAAASWSALAMVNPFDWKGPDFLELYVVLLAFGLMSSLLIRRWFRLPSDFRPEEADQLDPYEVACLAGDRTRAVGAALASLIHAGVLELTSDAEPNLPWAVKRRHLKVCGELPPNASPLERALVHGVSSRTTPTVPEVVAKSFVEADFIADRLKSQGFLVADEYRSLTRTVPAMILFALAGFGGVKVAVGMVRGKPTIFLVVLCVVTLVAAAVFLTRPWRSRRGDQAVRYWSRKCKSKLAGMDVQSESKLSAAELAVVAGVLGFSALPGGHLFQLSQLMNPNAGGGSGGSGCGGGGGGCGGCSGS